MQKLMIKSKNIICIFLTLLFTISTINTAMGSAIEPAIKSTTVTTICSTIENATGSKIISEIWSAIESAILSASMPEIESEMESIIEPEVTPKIENLRSIYLTAHTVSTNRFWELIDTLIKNGGNGVVIDIELGGGKLAFIPKNEFLKNINPGSETNDYKKIVEDLHEKGLYVIARQVVFNDPYTSVRRPDWRIKYKSGGHYDYRWLDPSKAGVQNYNLMIMEEVAQLGFDEIQFDYIRFPAANHYNLDYWYDEEKFGTHNVINHFLKRAKKIANEYDVALSVDTFGGIVWGDVDWRIVGQEVESMAKIVDVIYPMTYPSHYSPGFNGYYNMYYAPYDIVHDSIKKFVEKANGNAEIRPYIQGFNMKANNFGKGYIAEQIKAGYDAGGTGFAIWNASNNYNYSWGTLNMATTSVDIADTATE